MLLIYALMMVALGWVLYLWIDDAEKERDNERAIQAQRYYAQYGQGAISLHFIRPRRRSIITIGKDYIHAQADSLLRELRRPHRH